MILWVVPLCRIGGYSSRKGQEVSKGGAVPFKNIPCPTIITLSYIRNE